jgi:hypothetical protein
LQLATESEEGCTQNNNHNAIISEMMAIHTPVHTKMQEQTKQNNTVYRTTYIKGTSAGQYIRWAVKMNTFWEEN